MTSWTVDLCSGWRRIGWVSQFELTATERWLTAGEWQLSCSLGAPEWDSGRGPADVDTVRLVVEGEVAFAGFVAPVRNSAGGLNRSTVDGQTALVWSGPDLWDVFARRVSFPSPNQLSPWPASHDVRSGQASAVLSGFLRANLGDTALASRRIPGVTVVDEGAGATGSWSTRLEPLPDLVTRVCRGAGITCRPTVDFDGNVTVTIGAQSDRTADSRISDQGDISVFEARQSQAATFAVVGGQGELTARAFAEADTGAAGLARREVFVNQSGTSEADELAAAAAAAVARPEWSVRVEPAGELDIDFVSDVVVGDLVGVYVDGVLVSVPVTAVVFTVNAERKQARPVLGGAVRDELSGLLAAVDELSVSAAGQVA